MYGRFAGVYDKIYHFKDYEGEAGALKEIIIAELGEGRHRLLEVACGTGLHLVHLEEDFKVEGLDLSPDMLATARKRMPDVPFHEKDMVEFSLGREFDAVSCLFSSIGYVATYENLVSALSSMARHLRDGGLCMVEPWFTPDQWKPGHVHVDVVDEPELKIVRMNTSLRKGSRSLIEFHFLVGTPAGTEHFTERHDMKLFTRDEMLSAFDQAGFEAEFRAKGIGSRGLYMGIRRRRGVKPG